MLTFLLICLWWATRRCGTTGCLPGNLERYTEARKEDWDNGWRGVVRVWRHVWQHRKHACIEAGVTEDEALWATSVLPSAESSLHVVLFLVETKVRKGLIRTGEGEHQKGSVTMQGSYITGSFFLGYQLIDSADKHHATPFRFVIRSCLPHLHFQSLWTNGF